jgi:GAF domain-containing protein
VIILDYNLAELKIKYIINKFEPTQVMEKVVDFLYESFEKYSWIGIYLVEGNDLILGPWRGEYATEHTKIPIGEGICGSAAASGKTEVVPDVNADDRYLACFVSTKSEIVVPIIKDTKILGEIDIDSDTIDAFTTDDKEFLEKVANNLSNYICF